MGSNPMVSTIHRGTTSNFAADVVEDHRLAAVGCARRKRERDIIELKSVHVPRVQAVGGQDAAEHVRVGILARDLGHRPRTLRRRWPPPRRSAAEGTACQAKALRSRAIRRAPAKLRTQRPRRSASSCQSYFSSYESIYGKPQLPCAILRRIAFSIRSCPALFGCSMSRSALLKNCA